MQLIKNILMDLEYYGALNSVDEFLAQEDVEGGSVVQTLIFDKSLFPNADLVREWIETHGFSVHKEIEEADDSFRVRQLDPSEFVQDSFKTIDIREGVKAVVGILMPMSSEEMFAFSLRNSENSIKLGTELPHIIEVAKVVSGYHPSYGKVEITTDMLKSFIRNFNDDVYGVELSIDYDHETREAAGWIRSLFLDYEEKVLLAEVKWTPKGALSLNDREFRYFSPEFVTNYVHPHTGTSHGPTLFGGALVNRPFLKMNAIVSLKSSENTNLKQEPIVETIALSEHKSMLEKKDLELKNLQLNIDKANDIVSTLKDENKKLSEKIDTIEKEKAEAKRLDALNKLFSENKINKAQLDLLKEKPDASTVEVLALSETMNVAPKGFDGSGNPIVLSEQEKTFAKKMGLTDEEYVTLSAKAR